MHTTVKLMKVLDVFAEKVFFSVWPSLIMIGYIVKLM